MKETYSGGVKINHEKILLITLFLLFLMIGAVSATSGVNDDVSNDNNVLGNYENNLLTADAGTFSDLQSNITCGGTVTLERNYTFDEDQDYALFSGIPIDNDVIIDGQGKVVIDAQNQLEFLIYTMVFQLH